MATPQNGSPIGDPRLTHGIEKLDLERDLERYTDRRGESAREENLQRGGDPVVMRDLIDRDEALRKIKSGSWK
jgi:hypothetical protein